MADLAIDLKVVYGLADNATPTALKATKTVNLSKLLTEAKRGGLRQYGEKLCIIVDGVTLDVDGASTGNIIVPPPTT